MKIAKQQVAEDCKELGMQMTAMETVGVRLEVLEDKFVLLEASESVSGKNEQVKEGSPMIRMWRGLRRLRHIRVTST